MSGDRTLWEPFVPLLAPRFRLIAVDLPGHGDAVALEPGLLPQLRGLRAVIEALDPAPLGLVGHSMGTLPAILFRSSTRDVVGSIAVEASLDLAGLAATFGAERGIPEDEREHRSDVGASARAGLVVGEVWVEWTPVADGATCARVA